MMPDNGPDMADTLRTAWTAVHLKHRKRGGPKKRKGSPRFSMRLSAPERARLETDAKAAGMALASYVKLRLFHNIPGLPQPAPNRPAADTQMIARLLAVLGEARLSQNLNQLAKAANMGTLEVSTDTETALQAACVEVQAMRRDLVIALGLRT
jgi:hypothetical protein